MGRDDARIGRAYVPADRISAQAYNAFEKALVVTVPKEAVLAEPIRVEVRGGGVDGAAYGHIVVVVEPLAEAIVVLDHQGSAVYADNVEFVVGDGATLQGRQPAGLGRTTPCTSPTTTPSSPRTPPSAASW